MSWWLIAAMAAGAYGLKAFGVTLFGGIVERRLQAVVSLLPAALFAAMIMVMTLEQNGGLTVDARVAGVSVGAIAAWRKAPFIVIVAVAMAVTAGLRAIT